MGRTAYHVAIFPRALLANTGKTWQVTSRHTRDGKYLQGTIHEALVHLLYVRGGRLSSRVTRLLLRVWVQHLQEVSCSVPSRWLHHASGPPCQVYLSLLHAVRAERQQGEVCLQARGCGRQAPHHADRENEVNVFATSCLRLCPSVKALKHTLHGASSVEIQKNPPRGCSRIQAAAGSQGQGQEST